MGPLHTLPYSNSHKFSIAIFIFCHPHMSKIDTKRFGPPSVLFPGENVEDFMGNVPISDKNGCLATEKYNILSPKFHTALPCPNPGLS